MPIDLPALMAQRLVPEMTVEQARAHIAAGRVRVNRHIVDTVEIPDQDVHDIDVTTDTGGSLWSDLAAPIDVECPLCGAQPGHVCTWPNGQAREIFVGFPNAGQGMIAYEGHHDERVRSWEAVAQ